MQTTRPSAPGRPLTTVPTSTPTTRRTTAARSQRPGCGGRAVVSSTSRRPGLDSQLGLQLGDLEGEIADAARQRTQGRQRQARGQLGLQGVGFDDELGRSLQLHVALLGGIALGEQRSGSPGLGQVGLLARQLLLEPAAPLVRLGPLRAVGLQSRQGLLARGHLGLEACDLVAHGLQQAGVLGAFRAIAVDGRVELPARPGGTAIRAADGLLEPVGDARLAAGHLAQLGVADARGGPEEGLVGDAGDGRDALLDEREVADGLALDGQLGLRPWARETLHEATRLAVDLEVQGDLAGRPPCPSVGWCARPPGWRSALRKRTSSSASWTVDLPASLGPRTMVRPAAGRISRRA